MAEVVIRDAQRADAVALQSLRLQIVRDPLITFTTVEPTVEDVADQISSAQADGIAHLVAELEGRVIGHAYWVQFRGGPGYRFTAEHSIHLTADARGNGAGRILLEALIARAKAAGIKTFVAGISGGNTAGFEFHKKMGFVETGRMPNVGFKNDTFYDLILMQRSVT